MADVLARPDSDRGAPMAGLSRPVAFVLLGSLPVVLATLGAEDPPWAAALLTASGGLTAVVLARSRWSAPTAVAAVGAVATAWATVGSVGRGSMLYLLAVGLVVADRRSSAGAGRVPVVVQVPVAVAAVVWARSGPPVVVVLAMCVAAVVLVLAPRHPRRVDQVDRWSAAGLSAAVKVVQGLIVGVLAVPALYLPALLGAPMRRWRRRRSAATGSAWQVREVALEDELTDARRPFAPEPRHARWSRNAIAAAVSVVVVAALVQLVFQPLVPAGSLAASAAGDPPGPGGSSPTSFRLSRTEAFADAPWADEIQAEHDQMAAQPVFAELGIGDVTDRFTNITRGVRLSSTSSCSCPEVRVWWFGGSAAFGWYQRDEHTVPSELVRLAARDGVRLRIENRAVAGWTLWQEYTLFSSLLAFSPEVPTLSIFFDGFNDVLAAAALSHANGGLTSPEFPNILPMDRLGPLRQPGLDLDAAGGATAIGESAARKYVGLMTSVEDLSRPRGTTVRFVLQPDVFASPDQLPATASSFGLDEHQVGQFIGSDLAMAFDAAERGIGPGVLDLRHVFDATAEPVFPDAVHFNEHGARIVAEAIWADIGPGLVRAAQDGSAPSAGDPPG